MVWDWNGTLLDDLHIVIDSVNSSIAAFGVGPIDADGYRDHYTRPVKLFYESLFGRAITDDEWLRLNSLFHESYFELAETVGLAPDALDAMDLASSRRWTQSLLSMSPHDWLVGIVDRLEITERFELVDGQTIEAGGRKAAHLATHLNSLGLSGEQVLVVGDTPDDVAAARHVGAEAILFHGGSHHMEVLTAEGVPIAETLVEAVEIAQRV